MKNEKNECCPVFHSKNWDEKTLKWNNKPFIKAAIPTLFHIPFPKMIEKRITKMMKMAEESNKMPENAEEILLLFTDPHPFKSELFLSVTGNVPNAENTTISGEFLTKVFDGSYNDALKFIKQMNSYLGKQGKTAKKYYIHYAYCPKCVRKFGHNYQLLFAEV